MNPTVAAVMTPDPITVDLDTPYKRIAELLTAHHISAVPVVNHRGAPVGVVSEADLLPRMRRSADSTPPGLLAGGHARREWAKSRGLVARDLMTMPIETVSPDETLAAAAAQLGRSGFRRLFVVERGRLVGVLSRGDLLQVYRRPDDQIRAEIERDVLRRALWADAAQARVSVEDGVATLVGRLDSRSECDRAGLLTARVPGVVAVRNRLDFVWDDQDAHGPHPAAVDR
ncbi:CBS domain-containing protein [Amycolatopsis anabasis]|uniref:CBS domain-containing protein n=1 Tax=Amycolatopsis anabasis TaxID=1840409 RepID=UPI00131B64CB|nr:CBS domain-containing protein [Amycolatopsis anabasis]